MENQDRIHKILALKVLLLLLFLAFTAHAACPSISGELRGLEHDIAGSISISEDCTLSVSSFSYDGQAPQVFWWGAPDCSAGTIKKEGERISNQQLVKSYTNGKLSVPLLQDIEWSNIGCISVYCEEFYADLGDISFTPIDVQPSAVPSTYTPTPTPSLTPPPAEYESINELSSCTELIPGYFNLHWQIEDATKTLVVGLEGRPGNADSWLGFGFSAPAATGPQMVGSNVVVAGMVKGKCFAYPYILSSQSQCDYSNADGVCPDFAGQDPLVPTKSIEVLSCEKEGDKLSVLMKWQLGATDGGKNNINIWPTDGSQFSIYAMGPISEGSNSTIPVVLYHSLKLPGTSAPASINAKSDTPLKINLSAAANNNCRTIVPNTSTSPSNDTSPAASPAANGGNVATIDGPTTLNITIGSNKNYPNPPAWGYSLWVNNQESPVLVVRRGTTYTFNVAAGPTHPVYITSSIIGGGLLVDYADETVFAGNDTTVGTPGKPTRFTWTPGEKTPDLVYYQCVVHQKLGWQIKVVDAGVGVVTAAGPSTSLAPAPAPANENSSSTNESRCTITIQGKTTSYNACIPLSGVGNNFNMAWNLDPSTSSGADSSTAGTTSSSTYELTMGLNATSNGWVSVAFPTRDGFMVGSSAMVLRICATCTSGAEILEYYLGGQTVGGVQPANKLNATALEASFTDGMLSGTFKVKVPRNDATGQNRRRRRWRSLLALDSAASDFPFIFASGDLSSNGNLQQHATFGSTSLDISRGLVSQGNGSSSSSDLAAPVIVAKSSNGTARTAHMWLMAIGFGVLIPIGIVIARFWSPPKSSTGFNLHRAIQTLGFLLGVAGIVCGFIAGGGWSSKYTVHRNIGMAVIVLCFLQVLALVWRPKLEAKARRPWALGHRWMGRIVAILAIANIYYGIIHVAALGTWAWATYTAILGAIVLIAVGKESIDCAQGKRSTETSTKFDKEKSTGSSSSSSLKPVQEV